MLLDISGEITPERKKGWSQSKNNIQLWMWLVIEARFDALRAILHRNLECQVHDSRKLEVVKQEMARVNVDILGISELKWTGMGEFNSDDHYIYYYGPESFWRNGVAIIVNKRVWNAVLGCSLKNDRMICSFPRQTIQYHINPSLPQLVMLKKLKLNSSMKTYKTF